MRVESIKPKSKRFKTMEKPVGRYVNIYINNILYAHATGLTCGTLPLRVWILRSVFKGDTYFDHGKNHNYLKQLDI